MAISFTVSAETAAGLFDADGTDDGLPPGTDCLSGSRNILLHSRIFSVDKFSLTTYRLVGITIPTGRYTMPTLTHPAHDSRSRLLDAALYVIRAKGYSAARIDDFCDVAGLTKGSFFHHFSGKEDFALAAAEHFSAMADSIFSIAPYHHHPDPLDRLLGYVDFRKSILQGDLPEYTCLLGTMVQETYETHPAIRKACDRCIAAHAATLVADIEAAIHKYGVQADWTVEGLAYYTQAVIQGSFILAKAQHSSQVAVACLDHLRRYLELLFTCPKPAEFPQPPPATLPT
jgi:TetR/AcrR family transcriptional regulator, transcriptional repressor for nem operon